MLQNSQSDFTSLQMQLQPRRPTTGNVDFLLPLQPELLIGKLRFRELHEQLIISVFRTAERKEPSSTLMAHFNFEPKVTLFAETSSSSGFANDKDENLHNE